LGSDRKKPSAGPEGLDPTLNRAAKSPRLTLPANLLLVGPAHSRDEAKGEHHDIRIDTINDISSDLLTFMAQECPVPALDLKRTSFGSHALPPNPSPFQGVCR
jgi:hypothetical protein